MITCPGVEYIQGDCVYRAKYKIEQIPGDNKTDDFVLGFLYYRIITSSCVVAEKECKNTAAVERRKRYKIKHQQDNIK